MKYYSAGMGAEEVSVLAKELEAVGKKMDLEYIDDNIYEFRNKNIKFLTNIDEFINKENIEGRILNGIFYEYKC